MCQSDNMPIVEEMQAQAQAKARWIIDVGLLDFRQKNKDKRQFANVRICQFENLRI